eukprot:CAMPEP_0177653488 /NCGR_PEP_ID=MMETSP0447-20121125/13764_1 /TAXON_ID=0 /ORGANISM="Stygamoeba regulata, Strain BSH-02190019" /LENGTH=236 /DNA_ID=CAMNT_0019156951 /DNA_START=56 /DNA_END=766 /DNA_ORIENTATION=-
MKVALAILVICLASFVSAAAIDLGDDDFAEKTKTGVWLVKFFAPWCGHCKRLAPLWEEMGDSITDFNVAKVDCTIHKKVQSEQGVRGYPTIKLFIDGKAHAYSGPRTKDAFIKFVNEKTGKAPAEAAASSESSGAVVLTADNFDAAIKDGLWLIKFYAPWCGHCKSLAPTWEELAGKTDGKFKVGKVDCTQNQAVCSKFNVRGYPTLKLFKDGAHKVDYSGPRKTDSFIKFVQDNA